MEPISGSISADQLIGWYGLIKQAMTDFSPEAKSISINFPRSTIQISFLISIPEGWRKRHNKIKIPASPEQKIQNVMDDGFNLHSLPWTFQDNSYILDAKTLPSSERYLIKMEGLINSDAIKNIIYIKPSVNKSEYGDVDKYWLESSIKMPKILEQMYKDLEVDEVSVGVKVDIQKMFRLAIPEDINERITSIQRLLSAATSMSDRNELFRSAIEYRKLSRIRPKGDPGSFFKLVQQMTGQDVIRAHLKLEKPYDLGNVQEPTYIDTVPQSVLIQTITRLTLKDPTASGYLTFERKKYIEKLRLEFDKFK